jgi:hypothetical protein
MWWNLGKKRVRVNRQYRVKREDTILPLYSLATLFEPLDTFWFSLSENPETRNLKRRVGFVFILTFFPFFFLVSINQISISQETFHPQITIYKKAPAVHLWHYVQYHENKWRWINRYKGDLKWRLIEKKLMLAHHTFAGSLWRKGRGRSTGYDEFSYVLRALAILARAFVGRWPAARGEALLVEV